METVTIPEIGVICRANMQVHAVLYRDEPLTLSVTIQNMDAVTRGPSNMALSNDRRELEAMFREGLVSEEQYRSRLKDLDEKAEKYLVLRFGSPGGWTHFVSFTHLVSEKWIPLPWPLVRMEYYPNTEYAMLDEINQCDIHLGLDPADGAKVDPGEYHIRSEVEILPGTIVVSDPVAVEVKDEPVPEKDRESEEFFYRHSFYWKRRGQYDKAFEYARTGLSHFPGSTGLMILLGDIEDGRKNPAAALHAYETALAEIQKNAERRQGPPDALIYRITKLRSSLRG
jgi:hypothetical protein